MLLKNQSRWKAVILDLDGTLLHSDGSISEYTLEVLQECKRRDIPIVVATARFWFKAEKYIDMIDPDYAILADGTQIYHEGEMICGFAMELLQSDGIIKELLRQNVEKEFVVSTGKKLLCNADGINEKWRVSRDFSQPLELSVYKIAAIMDSCEEAKALADTYDCRVYSYRGESLYGFTDEKSGKYQAVAKLGEILQIRMDEMLAFGDDENDFDILRHVGKGVAVANAIPEIKEIVDDVTLSNDEDGVAKYIEKEIIPFWEKTYRQKDVFAFSSEPSATIKEFEHLFKKEFQMLEVGCGEAQNAIYLAQKGYRVDAFDLSEHGIAKVNDRCERLGIKLNAFAADLTEYEFVHKYDVIISFGTLHFVYKDDWKKFIKKAKEHTNPGGIHIIQLFSDAVPASDDIASFAVGLAKDGEIRELYGDWEILQFKTYVFEDEHPGVPKHLHASNKIVARKKESYENAVKL